MALHYQESLNDKTWLNYLIRKSKHGSQFDLNGHWIFIWWKQGEDCEKSSVAKQIHLEETKFQIIRNATEEVWFNDGRGFS